MSDEHDGNEDDPDSDEPRPSNISPARQFVFRSGDGDHRMLVMRVSDLDRDRPRVTVCEEYIDDDGFTYLGAVQRTTVVASARASVSRVAVPAAGGHVVFTLAVPDPSDTENSRTCTVHADLVVRDG
jgi:hypothetical protein